MTADRQKQMDQAEEMLGESLARASFVRRLFAGRLPPAPLVYPDLGEKPDVVDRVGQLRRFCREQIDPVAIDRAAEIPASVIAGLGRLGILGACLPASCGGLDYTQSDYCQLVETLGGHCASTALFVNAHHSIGPRAIVLFGTPEQQGRYLPKLATGEWISAFALTEPEAGSDAANVQTRAEPTPDGRGYLITGEKRWITNGGIAGVLNVMARTPVAGSQETKITAFIVTPDMPGFRVVEPRMEKCGVRGTATARLAFDRMFVPRENVLGALGKGLKVALTVLDYGRVTFGASCTGAAKDCLRRSVEHVNRRVQFSQKLATFELVKEKIAFMAAHSYAMEAATYQTAALIDAGCDDYMVETAMLKVFATESLWRIVNDTFQLHGGLAYFTDQPFERMMRDARINMIGEGANDVLRAFIALAGMRDVGLELKDVWEALQNPAGRLSRIGGFAAGRLGRFLSSSPLPVRSAELQAEAEQVGRLARRLGQRVDSLFARHREEILDRQLDLARVGDAATELYVSCCVLSRMDRELSTSGRHEPPGSRHEGGNHDGGGNHHTPGHDARGHDAETESQRRDLEAGRFYLRTAARRIQERLDALGHAEDAATVSLADLWTGQGA